jgi:hypothetical protein
MGAETEIMQKVNDTMLSVNAGMTDIGKRFDSMLQEIQKGNPEPEPETEVAKLKEAGVIGGVLDFTVWDIPVGQAVVGGGVAVLFSEVIDGFLVTKPAYWKAGAKLVAAGAAVKWGSKYIGSTGSKAVALLLAFDAIRQLVPFDLWIKNNIVSRFTKLSAEGLTQDPERRNPARQNPAIVYGDKLMSYSQRLASTGGR